MATVGSLIYSEVIHFEPCRLCWFQRIAMYPMAIVLLVGAIRREFQVKYYALPLTLIGLAISVYHYLMEVFPVTRGRFLWSDLMLGASIWSLRVHQHPVYGRQPGLSLSQSYWVFYVNKNNFNKNNRSVVG